MTLANVDGAIHHTDAALARLCSEKGLLRRPIYHTFHSSCSIPTSSPSLDQHWNLRPLQVYRRARRPMVGVLTTRHSVPACKPWSWERYKVLACKRAYLVLDFTLSYDGFHPQTARAVFVSLEIVLGTQLPGYRYQEGNGFSQSKDLMQSWVHPRTSSSASPCDMDEARQPSQSSKRRWN